MRSCRCFTLIFLILIFSFMYALHSAYSFDLLSVEPGTVASDGAPQQVVITGTDFQSAIHVYLDNEEIPYSLFGDSQISFTVAYDYRGNHPLELRDEETGESQFWEPGLISDIDNGASGDSVAAISSAESNAPLAGVFTPIYLDSADPSNIPADGLNHVISIVGSGYSTSTQAFVDGVQVTSTFVDPHDLTISLHYLVTANHTLEVTNSGTDFSAAWEQGINSIATNGLIVWPSYGLLAGGDTVTILGLDSSFSSSARVYFDYTNSSQCLTPGSVQQYTVLTDTEVQVVTAGSSTAGPVAVYVHDPNGSVPDICMPNAFTYVTTYSDAQRNAQFLSGSSTFPSSTMIAGNTYSTTLAFKNTGTKRWRRDAVTGSCNDTNSFKHIKLGAQTNDVWGANREYLRSTDCISTNSSKSFNFTVKAPKQPGFYNFEWQMIWEDGPPGKKFFGQTSGSYPVTVTAPSGVCPVTNPNDGPNTTREIQICIDTAVGDPAYVILGGNTTYMIGPSNSTDRQYTNLGLVMKSNVYLTSSNAPCNETTCAKLEATSDLASPMLQTTVNGVSNFYIDYLTIDGNGNARTAYPCNAGDRQGGSSIRLEQSPTNWHVTNCTIENSRCGTALAATGYNFEISSNTIKNNGSQNVQGGNDPWSDGITLLNCNRTNKNAHWVVKGNTLTDNTDIDLVDGGGGQTPGTTYGCRVLNNQISQTSILAHGGLHVANFPENGAGDHTHDQFTGNSIDGNINSPTQTYMWFGLAAGHHSWKADHNLGNYVTRLTNGSIANNGTSGNPIQHAAVLFEVEGLCDGNISNNYLGTTRGQLPSPWTTAGCPLSNIFTRFHWFGTNFGGNPQPSPITQRYDKYGSTANCSSEPNWTSCGQPQN